MPIRGSIKNDFKKGKDMELLLGRWVDPRPNVYLYHMFGYREEDRTGPDIFLQNMHNNRALHMLSLGKLFISWQTLKRGGNAVQREVLFLSAAVAKSGIGYFVQKEKFFSARTLGGYAVKL